MDSHELKANMAGNIRSDVLEGRDCWIMPVVMMTEGVHNGSAGSVYYPAEELEKYPEVWNHKPVVIHHPEENGEPVIASSPEVSNTTKVGMLFNTRFEGGRLKADAWIYKDRLQEVAPAVHHRINAGQVLEVSTGLFFDPTNESGVWNGENYTFRAENLRPDHLAILPDEIGACSVADGAGIPRLNQRSSVLYNRVMAYAENEESVFDVMDQVRQKLEEEIERRGPEGELDPMAFVEDVFTDPGYVVYSRSDRPGKYFKRDFTIDDGKVELADRDNTQEVIRKVVYQEVNDMTDNSKVEELSEKFEQLSQTVQTLATNMEQAQAATQETEEDDSQTSQSTTVEEYVKAAPDGIREPLEDALGLANQQRKELIETLTANESCPFSEDELKTKPTAELQKLSSWTANQAPATQSSGYYGLNMAGATNSGSKPAPLLTPGMKQAE